MKADAAAHDSYDALERRAPAAREAALMAELPRIVARAQSASPAFADILRGVEARTVCSRSALAALPVTRKHELLARQQAARATGGDALGGFSAVGWRSLVRTGAARRVFQSPGPIYEAEGQAVDSWRMARALFAAGMRAGDLLHNSFSYHLTPAGAIMESAAHALGCTVFAGGVGQTELQLQAIADLRPDGYCGTPSFLKILLDQAAEDARPLSLRRALVSGEACPPSLQARFRAQGVEALQCYASADVGLIAYETSAHEGLVLDEGVIVEIVRPGSSEPVPEGDVGEVVVTVLDHQNPLLRFGTGDLSAWLAGPCPSGRTAPRIKGWLGRADQTTKVRGMFVHPAQVADAMRRHPEVLRARLVVGGTPGSDTLTLRVEVDAVPDGLAERLGESLRRTTQLRCEVELLAPGSLPSDGKTIEDARHHA